MPQEEPKPAEGSLTSLVGTTAQAPKSHPLRPTISRRTNTEKSAAVIDAEEGTGDYYVSDTEEEEAVEPAQRTPRSRRQVWKERSILLLPVLIAG